MWEINLGIHVVFPQRNATRLFSRRGVKKLIKCYNNNDNNNKKKVLLHWNVFVYGAFKVHNPSFKQMKYLMIGSHSALTPKPS